MVFGFFHSIGLLRAKLLFLASDAILIHAFSRMVFCYHKWNGQQPVKEELAKPIHFPY
jgi:hypothetical protein